MKIFSLKIQITIVSALLVSSSLAQTTLVNEDYNKALWMSTRFFGGQRMTDNSKTDKQQNWLVQGYLPSGVATNKTGVVFAQDADAGYDLSGGWVDCGDHVFFGQTGFYAGYMLAKMYDIFPQGFDDYYSPYYTGYKNSGDYSWEGKKGIPNGVPDVLDEVKHQTDFFIKCARSSTQFYFEKGEGNADHAQRVTAVKMQTNPVNTGGEPRKMWSNPNDASMPAMCAATLALMGRLYKTFDPAYAEKCLIHAKYAYDYSMSKTGSAGAASGGFYPGNDNFNNGRAIMLSEMFLATGTESYKTSALALSAGTTTQTVRPNVNYTFDYSNTGEMALYCLAEIGHTNAKNSLKTHIENKFIADGNYNTSGVYQNGGGWGKLRYVGNAAMIVAMYKKLYNQASLNTKVFNNIDYILGKNSGNWSYLVGFSPLDNTPVIKIPTQAHHRNLYLYEGNNNNQVVAIPDKNKQFGALVGGSLDGTYNDVWTEYVNTEVCVDYNVGLVGALAAIKEEKDPVDITKFTTQCAKPDLGSSKTLCGVTGGITLNSGLSTKTGRTFQWYKDGISLSAASSSATTLNVVSGGVYKVVVDSSGKCSREAFVTISATLPSIDLGPDVELCSPSTKTLDAGISGTGISYVWKQGSTTISGSTAKTYLVTKAGNYSVTASSSGCSSVTDGVVVTSLLPNTIDGKFCPQTNTSATLEVTSSGTGPYEWFSASTGGTKLFTGKIFQVKPTVETTYYVKDVGSFNGTVGPTATSGTQNSWGEQDFENGFYLKFSLTKDFKITSLSLPFGQIHSNHEGVVAVEIRKTDGTLLGTFSSDPKTLSTTSTAALHEFTFSNLDILSSWGTDLIMNLNKTLTTVNGSISWQNGGTSYPYTTSNGAVTITGSNTQGQSGSNYVYFYNWKISSGTNCDRKPVLAKVDCNVTVGTDNSDELTEIVQLYPNPAQNSAVLSILNNEDTFVQIIDMSGSIIAKYNSNTQIEFGEGLKSGVYFIKVTQKNKNNTLKFILN